MTNTFLSHPDQLYGYSAEIIYHDLGERQRPNSTTYNSSEEFIDIQDGEARLLQAVRHESSNSETDSEVVLVDPLTRIIVPEAPVFPESQDPYFLGEFTDEKGEPFKLLGMVRIVLDAQDKIIDHYDVWYRYINSVMELNARGRTPEPFLYGVSHSKDTRLTQENMMIGVPRPQGVFGGLGRIGYFESKSILTFENDLHKYFEEEDETTLVDGLCESDQWVAAGKVTLDPKDCSRLFIRGHRGRRDAENKKIYEGNSFCLEREGRTARLVGPVVTTATASLFPPVDPKPNIDISEQGVVFPAGQSAYRIGGRIVIKEYMGVNDSVVGRRRWIY